MTRPLRPLLAAALLLAPAPAAAQPLRTRLADLFRFGECDQPLCLPVAAGEHGSHYVPAVVEGRANLIGFLTGSIGASIANLPISATSGGVVFTFEEGRPVRRQISTGPIYAERARTLGRGRLFVGANMSGFAFRTLAGTPLDALEFNFTHQNVGAPALGDPLFENDVIQVRADLNVSVLVTTFAATYGLSDRVDVGIAVPIVRTWLDGTAVAQVQPFGPGSPHVFGSTDDPRYTAAADTYGHAVGVGDVAARVKAHVAEGPRGSLALVGEARFATGDEEELLGAGHLSARGVVVGSATYGAFSPHVNLGYQFRDDSTANDAVLATIGFDQLVAPPVTLAVDLLSRWQVGSRRRHLPDPVTLETPIVRTIVPTNVRERRDDALDASLGFRFVTTEGITFVTNALVPLRRGSGFQPSVAWTAGLEYVF